MTALRLIAGLVLGFLAGSVAMMLCHFATMPLFPPPDGVEPWNPDHREQVLEWMKTLPDSAFIVAAFCHWIGATVGALVGMLVGGRGSMLPAWLVGGAFTIAGIMNLAQAPHPAWFPFVDLPGYLIVAFLVGRLLLRRPAAD